MRLCPLILKLHEPEEHSGKFSIVYVKRTQIILAFQRQLRFVPFK